MLEHQLMEHEGTKRHPLTGRHVAYRCPAGKLTVGYGRNLEGHGLSEYEAMVLLRNDIETARTELCRAFPWFRSVDEVRQAAFINMHFNMGLPTLRGFVKTLGAAARGDWDTCAREMLNSNWARQVKGRATELAEQVRTGKWQR